MVSVLLAGGTITLGPHAAVWVASAAAGGVAISLAAVFFIAYRRLGARLRRLEENHAAARAAPRAVPEPRTAAAYPAGGFRRVSIRPCADPTAPDELLAYGLDRCCYTLVRNGGGPPTSLVVAVAYITNHTRDDVVIRQPYLSVRLKDGPVKLAAPAPVTTLGRLNFYETESRAAQPLDGVKEEFLARVYTERSLNRRFVVLEPRRQAVTYGAFLVPGLFSLAHFDDELLSFGLTITADDRRRDFNGFRARPTPRLTVIFA